MIKRSHKITPFDITLLLRQLATLMAAGISILRCLDILEKSQHKTTIRLLIYAIKREMLTGKDLSSCLSLQAPYFDSLTCQLIKIGEFTGKLDNMLLLIANEKEKRLRFVNKIKQSLLYPSILSITALLVIFFMFFFVIPHFAELFNGTQIKLPLLTRIIFSLATHLQQHLSFFLGILTIISCLAIISIKFPTRQTKKALTHLQHFLLRLPLIKNFIAKTILIAFARNAALSFAAGVPINDALHLLLNLSGQQDYRQWLNLIRSKINSGLQLHQAMRLHAYSPDLLIQLVKIGEESGKLDQMLTKFADFSEAEIDHLTTQLNQLLEPLIILVLGVLIGGLVIGMYLPIFKLGSAL